MKQIIKAYKNSEGEIKIGIFDEKNNMLFESKEPIKNEEQLKQVLVSLDIEERMKPESQRRTIINTISESKVKEDPNDEEEIEDENYIEIIDKDGNVKRYKLDKKKKYSKIIAGTLSAALIIGLAIGVVSCSKKKSSAPKKDVSPETVLNNDSQNEYSTPKKDSFIKRIFNKEEESAEKSEITSSAPTSTPKITVEDKIKEYTDEEKIKFIQENIESFKNEVALCSGITLSENEALIQLGFINKLNPKQLNIETENYWLDFATDYNAILDEITIPTINYLSFDKKLKGSHDTKESIYKKYIMDEKDQKIYAYYADNMQYIIESAYTNEKGNTLDTAYEYINSIAETLVYPNNPIQKENVKYYLNTRKTLIEKNNKIPTIEEIANAMNVTINDVREFEVATLGVDTASQEVYFLVTLIAQKTVQFLPQDTIISYIDTLGEYIDENSNEDDQIMNYNAKKGKPKYTDYENYMHSKYLLLDIEFYMEKTISKILADYDELGILCNEKIEPEETCQEHCSVRTYNPNKAYVKKLTNYHAMQRYL